MTEISTAQAATYDTARLARVFNQETVLNQNPANAIVALLLFAQHGYPQAFYGLAQRAQELEVPRAMAFFLIEGVRLGDQDCMTMTVQFMKADGTTITFDPDIERTLSFDGAKHDLVTAINKKQGLVIQDGPYANYAHTLRQKVCDSVFSGLGWYNRSYPAAPKGQCGTQFQM